MNSSVSQKLMSHPRKRDAISFHAHAVSLQVSVQGCTSQSLTEFRDNFAANYKGSPN